MGPHPWNLAGRRGGLRRGFRAGLGDSTEVSYGSWGPVELGKPLENWREGWQGEAPGLYLRGWWGAMEGVGAAERHGES